MGIDSSDAEVIFIRSRVVDCKIAARHSLLDFRDIMIWCSFEDTDFDFFCLYFMQIHTRCYEIEIDSFLVRVL